jgi:hypothetical protein
MLQISLIFINFVAIITMYFLNDTISSLQKENSKLMGVIQNLNNEINYLHSVTVGTHRPVPLDEAALVTDSLNNPNIIVGLIGVLTITILGLTILVFLKNDTNVIGELSKNSIQATGEYVKEIIIPSIDLLNKSSESRVVANLDNVKKVVTDTGAIVTTHVTDVNREGVLCILNTIKPQVSTKVLGSISRELINLMP